MAPNMQAQEAITTIMAMPHMRSDTFLRFLASITVMTIITGTARKQSMPIKNNIIYIFYSFPPILIAALFILSHFAHSVSRRSSRPRASLGFDSLFRISERYFALLKIN